MAAPPFQHGAITINVDEMIIKLLDISTPPKPITHVFTTEELFALCREARRIFLCQPALIELEPPVKVCGDVHGQFGDVLRLFNTCAFPPAVNYLFLGDYVDRGHQNLELIILFLCYKIKYPCNFTMLRGNHECAAINRVYGFFEECNRRLQNQRIWLAFQDVFCAMPFTALIAGRILCMHGGLSPRLSTIDQLRQVVRPCDPPNPSLLLDLLWADPGQGIHGWHPNNRGVSFVFGADVLLTMMEKLDLDLIARAHQVVQDGYEFFGNKKLVTIFSAPHYCGQFNNAAAVMIVDENMQCSFQVLRPSKAMAQNIHNVNAK